MMLARVRRAPLKSVVVAVLAFLIGSATIVVATGGIPGPDGRIQGCYNQQNGNLRVVTSASECRNSEFAISWNERGPAGANGASGATGPAGPTGASGASGPAGPSGSSGSTGPTGPTGVPGTTLASLGQLGGLACTFNGANGTTVVSFDPTGRIALTCATGATPSPAQLSIAPAGHSFGSVPVGGSANVSFTVRNTGGSVTGTVATTTSGPFAIVGSNCTGWLAPAATCGVTVRFSPTAGGLVNGSLDVSASPGGTASASLSGSGAAAAGPAVLSVTPTSYSFGNIQVGMSVTSNAFNVTNTGATTTQPLQIVFSNFDFSTSSCGGVALAPGATCSVSVRFAPSVGGAVTGTMIVSAPLTTPVHVTLTGTGTTPATLSISPASHNFGTVDVGQSSSVTSLTVTNSGGALSTTLTPTISGPNASAFAITGSMCGAPLPPGTSCTVSVRFAPTAVGPATATLNVGSVFIGGVSAGLSGSGMAPGAALITMTPTSLNFGSLPLNASREITATVTNAGVVSSGPVIPTISGPNATAFAITGGSCGAPLAPAGSCNVIVRFSPAVPGTASGTLTMSASPGGSATATLTGTGLAPAALTITPSGHSFGTVPVGQFREATFSVTNTGGSPTGTIIISALPSPYAVTVSTCGPFIGSTLLPGLTCTVTVRFQPAAPGASSATLSVSASPGGTATAALDGSGALTVHSNGFGGSYLHASPVGIPGNPATYNNSMAFAAAQSVFVGGAPITGACSGFLVLHLNALGVWYTWAFTGPLAGHAISISASAAPVCPTPLSPTWN